MSSDSTATTSASPGHHAPQGTARLAVGAIGVVFGDIGTSPLYALKETFTGHHKLAVDTLHIFGIMSLVFWTMTLIVTVKYVSVILRADNRGEGGSLSLLAMISRLSPNHTRGRYLTLLGVLATALFFGDCIITPAISVLSAVEGLEIVSPAFSQYVIPLTLGILLLLFIVQKRGTAGIGKFFGPITMVWFIAIGVLGALQIAENPAILKALSPHYALLFMWNSPGTTFLILGAIVLCVTGAEALYADMGYFGKRPIRLAWFCVVMPALTLNYFGQGALLLSTPEAVKNPFYLMMPEWALLPMVGLATMATVIASQALISGAFSATKQIIQLGYLPRLYMVHTSIKETGQIYIPFINWALFIAIALAVVFFKSSDALATAYGIAVCGNMLITTILTFYVIRYGWKYPLALCLAATSIFFAIDFAFLASNALKFAEGGWFPILIAGAIFTLMVTWEEGRYILKKNLRADSIDLKSFLEAVFVSPPVRVEGTSVFLTSESGAVPNAMRHNLKHNKVLHETNLFVTVRSHEVPWINMDKRLEVTSLGRHCWQVVLNYGFKNDPDVPSALMQMRGKGCQIDPMTTSYFLSRDTVVPTIGDGMAPWREKLFAQMHRNASSAADFLNLPNNAVVELGRKVEI